MKHVRPVPRQGIAGWMRWLIPVFVLIIGGGPAPGSEALNEAELSALLGRLEKLQESAPGLTAKFRETRKSGFLAEPMVSTGELAFRAPASFRREITGKRPSLTVSDGKTLWIYYEKFKEAEKYRIGDGRPVDEAVQALLAGMNFRRVRESYEVWASRAGEGYELELKPKTRALRQMFQRVKLTLDAKLELVRSEASLSRGDSVVAEYSNIQRGNPSQSLFTFEPPPGTRISEPLP